MSTASPTGTTGGPTTDPCEGRHPEQCPPRRSRAWTAALTGLQGLTAFMFVAAALAKFHGEHDIVATFDAIGAGDWLRYLVAVLELAGAVALLVPRLAGLAATAFVALMIGAEVVQVFVVGDDAGQPVAFLLLSALIAWSRRHETVRLVTAVTRR